ncbi:MAG: diacylglycerol kinase family protein [Pseudomonadota bacterium]|nr:diacylglycerol kinase family protein [Pseudomonadota bacterium]
MLREPNARIHLALTVLALGASALLGLSGDDWRWILAMIALVWIAEIVNTALETLCDTLHPAQSEGIRIAKDLAAGAVLVAACVAAAVGVLTFWPYLFQ